MPSGNENTQCFGGLILVPSAKMTISLTLPKKCYITMVFHKYFSPGTVHFPIALR